MKMNLVFMAMLVSLFVVSSAAFAETNTTNQTSNMMTVLVNSDPQGARIYLDGEQESHYTGYVTPASITMTNEAHYIRLVKDDYGAATVTAGYFYTYYNNGVFNVSLIPLVGSMRVNSEPSGASVVIDPNGMRWGGTTPAWISSITIGTYTMTVSKSGYSTYTTTITIQNGVAGQVDVTLNVSATGILSFETTPSGATVSLSGVSQTCTSPCEISAPVGMYTITMTKSGYQTYTTSTGAEAGVNKTVRAILELVTTAVANETNQTTSNATTTTTASNATQTTTPSTAAQAEPAATVTPTTVPSTTAAETAEEPEEEGTAAQPGTPSAGGSAGGASTAAGTSQAGKKKDYGTGSFSGFSMQIKRTNPGTAKTKSAEVIFDVVNMDFTHQLEGFVLCRSPDDAVVSSTLGIGTGSGAQYVSPKFLMNTGPSQKAITLTLDSDTAGDKRTGCFIKYLPFKDVDGVRVYLKLNGKYVDTVTDDDYSEVRLDKSVPFSPEGSAHKAASSGGDALRNILNDIVDALVRLWEFLTGQSGQAALPEPAANESVNESANVSAQGP